MLNIARNNYFENQKESTIYTPIPLCKWLYDLLHPFCEWQIIIDPACGDGRLLWEWHKDNYDTVGWDIEDVKSRKHVDLFTLGDFLQEGEWPGTSDRLVICNPPYNHSGNNEFYKKRLLPELFLKKIIDLWGYDTKIVLFTPHGLRMNIRKYSKRYHWFLSIQDKLQLTSIITLPIDTFEGVLFHQEILIFNIPELKPHYWIDAKIFRENDLLEAIDNGT